MDWSNERYVRVYVRDTKTWLKARWQGQALFMMLLRKADRAGILDNIDDPIDDLELITGLPAEHVKVGYRNLIKLGVIEQREETLLIPNFMEAQESPKSDAQRQRESREKRRAVAKQKTVTDCDAVQSQNETDQSQFVTDPSQPVTGGHSRSQPVTPILSDPVPNQPEPSLADPNGFTAPQETGAVSDLGEHKKYKAVKKVKKQLKASGHTKPKTNGSLTWEAYAEAYLHRYGVDPVRNAKTNTLCKQLSERLGAEEAPKVAQYYLSSRNGYYVQRGHALECLVKDAEKVRTEWATGRPLTPQSGQRLTAQEQAYLRSKEVIRQIREEADSE